MTPDILHQQSTITDKTISSTYKQESIKLPFLSPGDEKYTQHEPLNISFQQISIYGSYLREQNISIQSKLSHEGLDTFGHIRRNKYTINKILIGIRMFQYTFLNDYLEIHN